MTIVKSFAVGVGDMYYIYHASDNFTVIDCHLTDESRDRILDEIEPLWKSKDIVRFISTHPDEDHLRGLEHIDDRFTIRNFYCVRNQATKEYPSESFKHYCKLRDGEAAFYISKGCKRRWMNVTNEERGSSGIDILWPNTSNSKYLSALADAKNALAYNNISAVVQYHSASGARLLWLGDLETDFMEEIKNDIDLKKCHIVFAPHHGRTSGKIPDSWLDKLNPEIIVIGEAPSRHLHYYTGYSTLTQNSAGDITLDVSDQGMVHIYCSSRIYDPGIVGLVDMGEEKYPYYKGTLLI